MPTIYSHNKADQPSYNQRWESISRTLFSLDLSTCKDVQDLGYQLEQANEELRNLGDAYSELQIIRFFLIAIKGHGFVNTVQFWMNTTDVLDSTNVNFNKLVRLVAHAEKNQAREASVVRARALAMKAAGTSIPRSESVCSHCARKGHTVDASGSVATHSSAESQGKPRLIAKSGLTSRTEKLSAGV